MPEAVLTELDKTLQQIAREAVAAAGNPRVEYDDMLQEARIGAWRGLVYGKQKEPPLEGVELKRYAVAAGRNECERTIAEMSKDLLYHCDNYGLATPDEAIPI